MVVGLAREAGAAVVEVQPVRGPHAQVLELHLDVGLARGQGARLLHPVGPVPELEAGVAVFGVDPLLAARVPPEAVLLHVHPVRRAGARGVDPEPVADLDVACGRVVDREGPWQALGVRGRLPGLVLVEDEVVVHLDVPVEGVVRACVQVGQLPGHVVGAVVQVVPVLPDLAHPVHGERYVARVEAVGLEVRVPAVHVLPVAAEVVVLEVGVDPHLAVVLGHGHVEVEHAVRGGDVLPAEVLAGGVRVPGVLHPVVGAADHAARVDGERYRLVSAHDVPLVDHGVVAVPVGVGERVPWLGGLPLVAVRVEVPAAAGDVFPVVAGRVLQVVDARLQPQVADRGPDVDREVDREVPALVGEHVVVRLVVPVLVHPHLEGVVVALRQVVYDPREVVGALLEVVAVSVLAVLVNDLCPHVSAVGRVEVPVLTGPRRGPVGVVVQVRVGVGVAVEDAHVDGPVDVVGPVVGEVLVVPSVPTGVVAVVPLQPVVDPCLQVVEGPGHVVDAEREVHVVHLEGVLAFEEQGHRHQARAVDVPRPAVHASVLAVGRVVDLGVEVRRAGVRVHGHVEVDAVGHVVGRVDLDVVVVPPVPAGAVRVVPLQPVLRAVVHVAEVEEQVVVARLQSEARSERVDGEVALVVGRRQVERRVARLLRVEVEGVDFLVAVGVLGHRPEVGVEVHVAQVLVDRQVERQGPRPVGAGREVVVGVVLGGRRAGGVAPGLRLAVVLAVDVPVELVLVPLDEIREVPGHAGGAGHEVVVVALPVLVGGPVAVVALYVQGNVAPIDAICLGVDVV